MSYKTDENYYFATTYKINWNWLKRPNLNEPCFSLPQWWCCFHHAGVSCVCSGCVEPFVSGTGAASGVLAQHHHLFFPSKTSPMHSFSLFCPHDISAFRTSYLLLPPVLQNLTKFVSHCPHIKDTGFPLWVATPYMNLGTLTYFPLLLIIKKKKTCWVFLFSVHPWFSILSRLGHEKILLAWDFTRRYCTYLKQ